MAQQNSVASDLFTSAFSADTVVSHFWVGSSPFFETTLFITPPFKSSETQSSKIELYDADGTLVNELEASFPEGEVGVFELSQVLSRCKLESGLRHGHLIVTSKKGSNHRCRIFTKEGASFLGQPSHVSDNQGTFFPVTFSEDRSSLLAVVNHKADPISIKLRLFCGQRAPDTYCIVPGYASRLFGVEEEFSDVVADLGDRSLQGYLRLGAKREASYGVQLIERASAGGSGALYTTVN